MGSVDEKPGLVKTSFVSGTRHPYFEMVLSPPFSFVRTWVRAVVPVLFVLVAGCDKNPSGLMDSKNSAPSVSDLHFSPDSVNIDNLTPSNGSYTVSTLVRARADDNDGHADLAGVKVDIVMTEGSVAVAGFPLRDDGVGPDTARGDGIFSGIVQFQLTRAQAGRWQVRVSAVDQRGTISNSLAALLNLARRNSPPFLTDVVVPDSVNLPQSGYILVQFTATAFDSDGLADVRTVYFRRIAPIDSNQTRFILKDDGGVDPPVNIGGIPVRSGDDVPGDGRFSFLIPLLSTSTRRTNIFGFQAIDSFGDTSTTVQRSFTIR